MGITIASPKTLPLPNDRTETYLKAMREIIDPSVQLILSVFPQMKSDRYSAIKKLCYVEMPVASQVVNLKTINNEKRLTSVAQKVILQVDYVFCLVESYMTNCKVTVLTFRSTANWAENFGLAQRPSKISWL